MSGTAFLDIEAVVIDGSFCRALLQRVIARTNEALQRYNWEGLWPATVIAGNVGPDAGALVLLCHKVNLRLTHLQ